MQILTNFIRTGVVLLLLIGSSQRGLAAEFTILPGLSDGQKMIMIEGPIEFGDDSKFYRLSQQAERATVFLNSPGGSVEAGLSIGAEIAIRGFATLVLDEGGCYSICAIMWVAGVRRYMSPNAEIGVHAAYRMQGQKDGGSAHFESGVANADIGAFLNMLGLSRKAVRYFTSAGPQELLPITPAIAQRLDIDVFVQDGFGTTTPEDRPTPRRITRQVADYAGMVGNCEMFLGVNPSYLRDSAEEILKRGHALFGGETFSALVSEYSFITKDEIEDLGRARWCIEAEKRLRSDGLSTGIIGPSYDCAKATTPTEYAICSSKDLWAMDLAMANLFFFYRRNTNTRVSNDFLNTQRAWLKRRDACGSDIRCVLERYSSRLFDFGA